MRKRRFRNSAKGERRGGGTNAASLRRSSHGSSTSTSVPSESAVLKAALAAAKAPAMRWYEATRHSFASRYVQAGGSLMKLAAILGHSATEVTLRYAHLQPATSPTRSAPWWTFSSDRPRCSRLRNGARDRRGSLTVRLRRRRPSADERRKVPRLTPGGVAERQKAAVLKTAGPQGLAGSNPASSANPASAP